MTVAVVWLSPVGAAEGSKPLTILVGIDGFRADYLSRGHTPTLAQLARQGATASGLTPVFPTVTFPNHVSLVTGRRPVRHGILNNTMWDPAIADQVFRLRDRQAVTNPAWWSDSEPIWVTAAKQGRISSTLFWPGSEVPIQGIQPRDWLPYQHSMSSSARVKQLLNWLTDVRPDRPQADFATLYFSEVDSEGHAHGPDSPAVNQAMARVDEALAQLMDGLKAAGLWSRTSLVIAADHGMTFVPAEHRIEVGSIAKQFPGVVWQWTGPTAGLSLADQSEPAVLQALGKIPRLTCWPKHGVPQRLGSLNHRRAPDVICLADSGWTVTDRLLSFPIPGQHGFDPDHEEMQGLFIAVGPDIRRRQLGRVSNLEVYPLLCALLGISPAANEASGTLVDQLLQQPVSRSRRQ
jgi:predicted AlkP superfamily pyrophosphatase or phosphodiesterase